MWHNAARMFGRKPPPAATSLAANGKPPSDEGGEAGQMALDTVASILRALGEFALDGEKADAATYRGEAEAWAQHVTLAKPPPGPSVAAGEGAAPKRIPASTTEPEAQGARRDWQGVRRFVREYCKASAHRATSVASDLRDTIWLFIHNFGQALAQDAEADVLVQEQVRRLEGLVARSEASELKREVMDAVGALTRALGERRERQRAQMATLGETVRALGGELESARREGETDPLTRVCNRKAFDVHLERTVEMYRAFRQEACLLLVDVDHFKAVNDGHGHAVGDEALRAVADAISKVFLRKDDFVSRFGGDEFAVILRETAPEHLPALAERLLTRVRSLRIPAGERELTLSLTVGGAALSPGDDARAWFERADRGLYGAKAAGRDRFQAGEAAPPAAPPETQPGH